MSPKDDRVVLRITDGNKNKRDLPIDMGAGSIWRAQEVLWAPNSTALLINGSENAYAGAAFVVHRLSDRDLLTHVLTDAAQRDMVKTFPPCKASYAERSNCENIARDPQFNMSAIAWTRDAKAVIVVAEVPCSSRYGGIMCQVMGYELEIPTGGILARMTARELKKQYQSRMAWTLRIPDPPEYVR